MPESTTLSVRRHRFRYEAQREVVRMVAIAGCAQYCKVGLVYAPYELRRSRFALISDYVTSL